MGDGMDIPDSVCMLDNTSNDWLFPRVDAVIHHGGAGTTVIGLNCGKPIVIVPFFGDQPFWSAMTVRAGAGAKRSLGPKS
jgi:UDP:flavonoid glycosyltransferase YjiC (YdhE family)